jgi:hypothetical protein
MLLRSARYALYSLCSYRAPLAIAARNIAALNYLLVSLAALMILLSLRSYLRCAAHILSLRSIIFARSLLASLVFTILHQVRCANRYRSCSAYLSRYARHFAVPMSLRSMSIARVSLYLAALESRTLYRFAHMFLTDEKVGIA